MYNFLLSPVKWRYSSVSEHLDRNYVHSFLHRVSIASCRKTRKTETQLIPHSLPCRRIFPPLFRHVRSFHQYPAFHGSGGPFRPFPKDSFSISVFFLSAYRNGYKIPQFTTYKIPQFTTCKIPESVNSCFTSNLKVLRYRVCRSCLPEQFSL